METPKPDHENPPPDIINIISSWLEVDDIYTPALPTDHHHQELQVNDFHMVDQDHHQDILGFDETSNEPVDLLQAFLPTPNHHHEDPPLFLFDDLYSLFHENVPADQTTQPQYCQLLQNPQPHVEPGSKNAVLEECNLFLLDDDELIINHANINTPDHINEENASHYHVLNVTTMTTTRSTTASVILPSSNVVGTSEPMRTTDEIIEGHVRGDKDEENEAEFMEDDDNPSKQKSTSTSTSNSCKNLVSERNRRKRLGQQLLALRALVPNITRMDKRSVLVDALAYLRSIHEETTRLQKELKQHHHQPNLSLNIMSTTLTPNDNIQSSSLDYPSGIQRILTSTDSSKSKTMITEVETEKIEGLTIHSEDNMQGWYWCGWQHSSIDRVIRFLYNLHFSTAENSSRTTSSRSLNNLLHQGEETGKDDGGKAKRLHLEQGFEVGAHLCSKSMIQLDLDLDRSSLDFCACI